MKDNRLIIWTFIFLASCGQTSNKSDQQQDTTKAVSVDTNKQVPKSILTLQQNEQLTNCSYDNPVSSLGQGLVIASQNIELFSDSLLTDIYLKWNIDSSNPPSRQVCSKYFKPDYHIMHFVCISKTDKYFKVIINFDQIKYIPNIKSYTFKSWGDYILQSYGIRRLIDNATGDISERQSLRKSPKANSEFITIPEGQELFCPIEIKDDWVKVKYDCFYNQNDNPHDGEPCHDYIEKCNNPVTSWLKWRQDNKV
jgi:hypothetical protein